MSCDFNLLNTICLLKMFDSRGVGNKKEYNFLLKQLENFLIK